MRELGGQRDRARGPEWLDGDIAMPSTGIDLFHRLSSINRRLRFAFLTGAEEESRQHVGRPLTDEELTRALRRYPGDLRPRS